MFDIINKLKNNEDALGNLINYAVILIALVAIFIVAGVIGDKLEYSPGLQLGANSSWNSSVNTKITSGRNIWENNAGLISVAATVGIIGLVIAYIIDFGGMRSGGGGGQ